MRVLTLQGPKSCYFLFWACEEVLARKTNHSLWSDPKTGLWSHTKDCAGQDHGDFPVICPCSWVHASHVSLDLPFVALDWGLSPCDLSSRRVGNYFGFAHLPRASMRNPAHDKVMRKEAWQNARTWSGFRGSPWNFLSIHPPRPESSCFIVLCFPPTVLSLTGGCPPTTFFWKN